MSNNDFSVFPVTMKISNQDIDKIIEKGLDEGSLHWCYNVESMYDETVPISRVIQNDGILLFYAMDRVYTLSKVKFLLGLQQALPYLTKFLKGDTLDLSSINSDDADFIIQLALFNELLFD